MSDEDSNTFNEDPSDDGSRDYREKAFTEWYDQLVALPSDFTPELRPDFIAHIELQPLRWMNLGLSILERRKESILETHLPYAIFQMGAEIFLKGMWLCQFDDFRFLNDDSYVDVIKRESFSNRVKNELGHDLLRISTALRQIPQYRDDAPTMRFLKAIDAIVRNFYYPLYQADKYEKTKWPNSRYPKRFYNDIARKGCADVRNDYPYQWLVTELFKRMKRDIDQLWDFCT